MPRDFVKEIEEELLREDGDIYSEGNVEEMLDDDEVTPQEAAFMRGYEEAR